MSKNYVLTESQQGELEIALIEARAVLKLLNSYLYDKYYSADDEGLPEVVSMVRHRLGVITEALTVASFERRAELAAKGIEADLL